MKARRAVHPQPSACPPPWLLRRQASEQRAGRW
jgi:hypothetical protein